MALIHVARKTGGTVERTRAMFTRVNFTCMDPRMAVKASLIGEAVATNIANKCLGPNCVVQHMLGAVREATKYFAAILTRVWSIVVVIVHMFPQIGLSPECLVTYFTNELPLAVANRTRRSSAVIGVRGRNADFAAFHARFCVS